MGWTEARRVDPVVRAAGLTFNAGRRLAEATEAYLGAPTTGNRELLDAALKAWKAARLLAAAGAGRRGW